MKKLLAILTAVIFTLGGVGQFLVAQAADAPKASVVKADSKAKAKDKAKAKGKKKAGKKKAK